MAMGFFYFNLNKISIKADQEQSRVTIHLSKNISQSQQEEFDIHYTSRSSIGANRSVI